jgi:ferric-dicitrate binding protein FerR (iron transport regulator)
MEQSDFDKLLERDLAGQVSEQERLKIEAWLNVMKTEDKYSDLELSKQDEDRLFQKITANVDNVDEIIALTSRGKKISVAGWVMRIAAGLLIASLVSYTTWYMTNRNPDRLQAAKNDVEKLILNDGSLAWLRGKSRLTFYEKPAEGIRYAEFQGEALFEIAKDASHPFVIRCGDATLRVMGTSFSVRTDSNSLELNVLTGRVHLSSETDKAGVDIEPKEKAIYTGNGGIKKLRLNANEVSLITTGTEYNMQFANTTMDQVAERIGKKFGVKINMVNSQVGQCRITADFTDHSLESTLQMITEVLDVEYARSGNTVTLTGPGCH